MPPPATSRPAAHSVRFVRDTLFEGAALPVLDDAWSPSGRWFVLRVKDAAPLVMSSQDQTQNSSIRIPERAWRFAWSPDEGVLACQVWSPGESGAPHNNVLLIRRGRAPELVPAPQILGEMFWLPSGALIGVTQPDDYVLLKPGSGELAGRVTNRLYAAHEIHASPDHGWSGLVPSTFAPADADPARTLPGWSRVVLDRKWIARAWWQPQPGRFVMQHGDSNLVRCDAMGRSLDVLVPLQRGALVHALTADGRLAVGRINPDPEDGAVRSAYPPFVWSMDGRWQAPIDGLEDGLFDASASPVDDRVLIQTSRGVELGRLVIDR